MPKSYSTTDAAPETSSKQKQLRRALEQHAPRLKNAACVYASTLGLATSVDQAQKQAEDVMQEAAVRAWETKEKYEEWPFALLRKYVFNAARTLAQKKRRSRLRLVADMATQQQSNDGEGMTEDELLDRLWYARQNLSERPDLDQLLRQLNTDDQRVLRLYLDGYLGAELALQLSKHEGKPVKRGTADVRLNRAKARLVAAYNQSQRTDS